MKKGGFLRNVLDTIRSNQTNVQSSRGGSVGGERGGIEYGGQLKPSHFALAQVARHGFPEHPTALAFDPVQKIAAIGTKSGTLRIFGRPGVDVWAQHEPAIAVTHIRFVVNQGAIITVTSDESIHLWSLRGPNLKLQFSSVNNQGVSSSVSPQAGGGISPAPTTASNLSSMSPQSGLSASATATGGPGSSTATSPSSLLGHLTDTVSGAVDSASDFLSGGCSSGGTTTDHHLTPSPTNAGGASRQPEILHTLKFQREHITCLHQTLLSKWLYIGTERGNVHVANIETFELSGYSIAWNKAIELSRKTHPGAIIHISDCPQDTNKLLIGYESGCIVLWDLKQRNADGRYYHTENLLWLSWHYEGKQFMAAHGDGSLITWLARSNAKPSQILHPHAKTASGGSGTAASSAALEYSGEAGQQQTMSLASSFARSLNNELYRPINKVDWKISRNNEQILLFSGGLPYDGLEQHHQQPHGATQDPLTTGKPPSRQSAGLSPARFAAGSQVQQQAQSQFLKASSASPSSMASPSPVSPSVSPGLQHEPVAGGGSVAGVGCKSSLMPSTASMGAPISRQKKSLRSTSLTVMYGKSITVLEMDDIIIDFITICDNSPYENDTSEPYAAIVLLSNELILIDLISPGYPSFDSPYPSASLSESPVTCVQYLADCSSDLIPFLYSTSQNVVSRAPKKGFSDKEWPINGGEWGQSMQSYPELVLTGHADGTIKFWDMSGINFDLISKIKTSKLFERVNRPPGKTILIASNCGSAGAGVRRSGAQSGGQQAAQLIKSGSPSRASITSGGEQEILQHHYDRSTLAADSMNRNPLDEGDGVFAIERIEFCPSTKHLLVAGAFSQVIQFKLNKKESQGAGNAELTTILVEPSAATNQATSTAPDQHTQQQHTLLKVRELQGATGSSSGGSSSSSSSSRARLSGFQAELVCLTPILMSTTPPAGHQTEADHDHAAAITQPPPTTNISSAAEPARPANSSTTTYYCQIPPKITALALQATHNILAYAHENGIVMVDIIQKCVILNASLSDLYGGSSIMSGNNRDISIQPFATSSILQHHYQATSSTSHQSEHSNNNKNADNGAAGYLQQQQQAKTRSLASAGAEQTGVALDSGLDTGGSATAHDADSLSLMGPPKSGSSISASSTGQQQQILNRSSGQQPVAQSRYTVNSMFQRQLSTNALNMSQSLAGSPNAPGGQTNSSSGAVQGKRSGGSRLFQRQMTASQLFSGGSSSLATAAAATTTSGAATAESGKQRSGGLMAGARADPSLAGSAACLASSNCGPNQQATVGRQLQRGAAEGGEMVAKRPAKNKRIISRMLSISAIQTTVGSLSTSSGAATTSDQAAATAAYCSDEGQQASSDFATLSQSGTEHHVADKFDSSFARSRSSSASSTTATGGGGAPNEHVGSHSAGSQASESIQCIAFLDPASSFAASGPSAASPGGGGGQASQVQSSASSNHKSLSTIAQASIKLPGQILCLAALTCEARGQQQLTGLTAAATGGGGSSSASLGASASQASSLEGEAHVHSPGAASSSSSAATSGFGGSVASGSVAPSSASHQRSMAESSSHSSFESRVGLFLVVVSEKQARIYQVPGPTAQQQQQLHSLTGCAVSGGGGAGCGSQTASQSDHHAHHHHHHPHQQQQSSSESPFARLLVNNANLYSKCDLSDSSYACRSSLVQMRQPDEFCLISYLASGNIVVHPLPRLSKQPPLLDADFVAYTNERIASSMAMSRNGHCLYQPSAGEICKFTVSSHYKSLVNEMTGALFVPREMPEMPRGNFFKSLFSISQSTKLSDRDELFGESSAGKSARNVAKHIGTPTSLVGGGGANLDKLKGAAIGTMGHEMRMAREGLDERGEKLSEIEDRTLSMMNQSEAYSQAAHQLAQKFKDKKWYQF